MSPAAQSFSPHPFSGFISRSASHRGLCQKEKKNLFSLPSLIFSDAIFALHSPWAPHRQPPVSSVVCLTFPSIVVAALRPLMVVLSEKDQLSPMETLRVKEGGTVAWRQYNPLNISMQSASWLECLAFFLNYCKHICAPDTPQPSYGVSTLPLFSAAHRCYFTTAHRLALELHNCCFRIRSVQNGMNEKDTLFCAIHRRPRRTICKRNAALRRLHYLISHLSARNTIIVLSPMVAQHASIYFQSEYAEIPQW